MYEVGTTVWVLDTVSSSEVEDDPTTLVDDDETEADEEEGTVEDSLLLDKLPILELRRENGEGGQTITHGALAAPTGP